MILSLSLVISFRPVFLDLPSAVTRQVILDRHGVPLSHSYKDHWNISHNKALHEIPEILKEAFILSEDKNFYIHRGIDWSARFSALWQNISKGHVVRGASTITEQVVRMVHPRRRTIWSKLVETFEAYDLESKYSKAEILDFYLNQIPYAAHRRGVEQASQYYFDRSLFTLTEKELLSLVILAQAPSAYDLFRYPERIERKRDRLAQMILDGGALTRYQGQELIPQTSGRIADVSHFVRYVRQKFSGSQREIHTTLDLSIQQEVQDIIDQRVSSLMAKNVHNAAALVIDHVTGDVLAWVVAGAGQSDISGGDINAVLVPRQPGSALKPFLYAKALDKGWNAATFINDEPLTEAVGSGLHRFKNYSSTHYGPVSVREALGNSLNIPALLTARYVGVADYLSLLIDLGFESLEAPSSFYDEGLALGNGEVTLFELAEAYTSLANKGKLKPLRSIVDDRAAYNEKPIFSEETAALVGNILSDPWARHLEFGRNSVLNFPTQTAVKTGTSTDYRDAWSVGYNDRFIVALWMGNLDREPMEGITGSTGPALALRSIFSLLNEHRDPKPLYLSPRLMLTDVCFRPEKDCRIRSEWLREEDAVNPEYMKNDKTVELVRPTDGLNIAYDPRIPTENQKFRFEVSGAIENSRFYWMLDGSLLAESATPSMLWPVRRGQYDLEVEVRHNHSDTVQRLGPVHFIVK